MVFKNKNNLVHSINSFTTRLSMSVMMLATLISSAELADREGYKVAVTLQPSYAYANQNFDQHYQPVSALQNNEQLRRSGKEEVSHDAASYGVVRRSHAITGKL